MSKWTNTQLTKKVLTQAVVIQSVVIQWNTCKNVCKCITALFYLHKHYRSLVVVRCFPFKLQALSRWRICMRDRIRWILKTHRLKAVLNPVNLLYKNFLFTQILSQRRTVKLINWKYCWISAQRVFLKMSLCKTNFISFHNCFTVFTDIILGSDELMLHLTAVTFMCWTSTDNTDVNLRISQWC